MFLKCHCSYKKSVGTPDLDTYLFSCRLRFLVVALHDGVIVLTALLQNPLGTLAACNNHGGQKQYQVHSETVEVKFKQDTTMT